ncbi:transcriptional regulator [Clavibacter michiganensis]|uniref:GAF and ANTAR domain-containing protein n=1 Tax=Clavibacter michiganensis TaxID=28447 RepID=UPI000CE8B527|nr:GAF and ANTAR domain-containing protein [Clavibacter michiganensis]PPF52180.1 transcriptional regulator [Clavibacter michiganensis]
MSDLDDDAFSALADSLADSDVLDVLADLVRASTRHTSATEGGIVLVDAGGDLHVVASTSERATDVEEAQLGALEGPALDCVRGGEPIEVPEIADRADAWPRFSRLAAEGGFRAAHATPMRLRGRTLGSLCLFSPEPGPLSDRDAALVQTLADLATLSVLQQHALDRSNALGDQLQLALDSRVVIEQAKGAIAQRMGITVDEAFTVLRRQARSTSRRLRDVAAEVLRAEGRTG